MPILDCFSIPFFQPASDPAQPPTIFGTSSEHMAASGPAVLVEVGFDPALFGAATVPAGVTPQTAPPGSSTASGPVPPASSIAPIGPTGPAGSAVALAPVQSVLALIDTGASTSCIDEDLAQKLQLPLINKVPAGGVGGSHMLSQYLCRLVIPQLNFSKTGAFLGARLVQGGQMHQALIGRDFLAEMILFYDGKRGRATLAY